ncbi:patatin-like phospholipase family protein [Nocardioides sp.]|uniref:patatin-like phospholipase family protein n=1 Tax=Nocardioides sp. TaxID=35761 RepID=UPI002ED026F8
MTTAFVLSGGGSLGAVQVGMLQALAARGVEPDMLVGTSAGALNAAWVAGHGTSTQSLAGLARVWVGLRRRDVFPLDARAALRGVLGRSPAVSSPDRLRQLVATNAGIVTFDEARIPLHLVAADLLSGQNVTISSGPLIRGVLASSAIPGVFPPVTVNGRHLIDGGVAEHTGITQAVGLGATVIYVLTAGTPCALLTPPSSAIGTAVQALTLLIEQRLAREISDLAGTTTIKVLPPLCPLSTSAVDFSRGAELISRARRASLDWMAHGNIDLPEPERFLALHRHHPKPPTRHPSGFIR